MFKLFNDDANDVIAAIHQSQAVIQFDLDGKIETANDNFLSLMGYSLSEIKGRHHRLFVEDSEAASQRYKLFWQKIREGEVQVGEFCRISQAGEEIWIHASYTPMKLLVSIIVYLLLPNIAEVQSTKVFGSV